MHACGVYPNKKGFVIGDSTAHEILCRCNELPVDRLHPLFSERATVLNSTICKGPNYASRPEARDKSRISGVVNILGFFFRIEVIKIAKKFVESMLCR